ncbi:MAG: acyltransferase [Deltaproteobacteria bacterium]|nr:acyltransferase [Deltaproteobacteria bacterium]
MVAPSLTSEAITLPANAPSTTGRLHLIDALRALASQLILWHHLALYGPLSDAASLIAPSLVGSLVDYARMTSVFFVVGGMVTARALTKHPPACLKDVGAALLHRWKRLGPAYLAVVALTIGVNALASGWMSDPMVSASPTLDQLLAHVFYLQNILGYESLSAGIWYVAIDFQLTALVVLALALSTFVARATRRSVIQIAQALFWPVALGSLFFFNLRAELDVWALYFFGSFFLGMAVQWALSGHLPRAAFFAYLALVIVAGLLEFRPRLLMSAAIAAILFFAARSNALRDRPRNKAVLWLGRMSYSVFLIHFPVWLLLNAVFVRMGWVTPVTGLLAMPIAWLLSIGAGWVFHRYVELPSARWASGK